MTIMFAHSGKFGIIAPTLRGHYDKWVTSIGPKGAFKDVHPSALLILDYFIEDADYEINRPFYLSLAVSFWPQKVEDLPSEFHTLMIHKEF